MYSRIFNDNIPTVKTINMCINQLKSLPEGQFTGMDFSPWFSTDNGVMK